jgi:hypothetical protein
MIRRRKPEPATIYSNDKNNVQTKARLHFSAKFKCSQVYVLTTIALHHDLSICMFTRKNQKKPVEPANCILFFFCVLRTGHVCPKSIHEDSYTSLNPQTFQNICWKKLTENIHEALSGVCQSLTHSIYYNVTIWSLNLLQLGKVQHTAMLDQFINEKYEFYCKVQTSKVLWLPM